MAQKIPFLNPSPSPSFGKLRMVSLPNHLQKGGKNLPPLVSFSCQRQAKGERGGFFPPRRDSRAIIRSWRFAFFLELIGEKDSIYSCRISFGFHFLIDNGHRCHGTAADAGHRIEVKLAVRGRFA